MDTRKVILKVHLYLGLASAIFLLILGLTGSIMAFEGDIVHWAHPSLWYVKTGAQTLPESQLIQNVEQQFAPSRVRLVTMPRQANLVQVMTLAQPGAPSGPDMRKSLRVMVNPYDGTIVGTQQEATKTEATLVFIHAFHLRLATNETGKMVINFAGLILLLEVPLGLILWWRTKRSSVQWKGSGFRLSFDLHHVLGVYAAVFLFLSALTGVLIGFDFAEPMIFHLTHSERMVQRRTPESTVVPGATPVGIDKALEVAQQAMPTATVATIQPAMSPRAAYFIGMRVPEEVTDSVHSSVTVDQYSGQVLRVQNFATESLGYRVIRFNRSLHTGDIYGMPTHILMSLTSLALVVMVVTGVVIWWKKLAV